MSFAEVLQGWADRYEGEDDPIGLPLNSTSGILEAFRVVKSGAGTLFGFSGFNSKVSAQFIQVFDAQTVPADASVPVFVMTAPTVANFSVDFGFYGRAFHSGIVIVNSSTAATKTIGAADCWFDAQYV